MNEALRFISDRCGRTTVTVNSSLNAVDAYRRFGFRDAAMRCLTFPEFASADVARFTIACLLKRT
jgi:hypothetical protein